MFRYRISYLCLLIASFLFYIFYVDYVSYFILLLICSIPFVSLTYMLIGMVKLHINVAIAYDRIYVDDEAVFCISTRTSTLFPLARVEAQVHMENTFANIQKIETVFFTSQYTTHEIEIPIPSSACGQITIVINRIRVYDFFGLFRWKKRKLKTTTCTYVFPKPITEETTYPKVIKYGEDVYDPHVAGNDTGETFDVRPYRSGDALHRIHWKLSAKVDDYMVREFSSPMEEKVQVYFNLSESLEDAQTVLAYVYGFSLHLLEHHHPHELIQYQEEGNVIHEHIEQVNDLERVLKQVLMKPSLSMSTHISEMYPSLPLSFYVDKEGVFRYSGGEQDDV